MTPILRTLAYHYLFQDPLTIEQIHEFLITPVPLSLTSVRSSVEQLSRQHQITRRGPYFTLLHVAQQNVRQHEDRMRASQEKLAIARRAAKVISFVPWVKLVTVTGALAMKNAGYDDDIDLMIVTSSNRLWLTRPLVMVLVSLLFKRRRPNLTNLPNLTNMLCLNLWLDEDALAIPSGQRNLYTAHELAQMKPLVNHDGTYERMMSVNKWGRRFLANAWRAVQKEKGKRKKEKGSRVLDILNVLAHSLQFWYMKSKMTTERVSLHAAYFHPGDRSEDVISRYKGVLRSLPP